jgi:hypothetical protein
MGFKTFKNGLDADVEALSENMERELFLEVGGEAMVDGERVGLLLHPRTPAFATTAASSHRVKRGADCHAWL